MVTRTVPGAIASSQPEVTRITWLSSSMRLCAVRQVQDHLGQIVHITSAPIGSAGGDHHGHWSGDARGALQGAQGSLWLLRLVDELVLRFGTHSEFLVRNRDADQRMPVDRIGRKLCLKTCVLGALTPMRWISLTWRWPIHRRANLRHHNEVPLCEQCVHTSRAISLSEFYELPHRQQCTPRLRYFRQGGLDDDDCSTGRDGCVPARGDGGHQRVTADDLVLDEEIERGLGRGVIQVALAIVWASQGHGDFNLAFDAARTLGTQFPTGRALPFFGGYPQRSVAFLPSKAQHLQSGRDGFAPNVFATPVSRGSYLSPPPITTATLLLALLRPRGRDYNWRSAENALSSSGAGRYARRYSHCQLIT